MCDVTSHVAYQRRIRADKLLQSDLVAVGCSEYCGNVMAEIQRAGEAKTNQSESDHSIAVSCCLLLSGFVPCSQSAVEFSNRVADRTYG